MVIKLLFIVLFAFANGQKFSFDDFIQPEKLTELLEYTAKTYSKIARLENVGKTFEGRNIPFLKISSDFSKNKPIIFMDFGMHPREWITQITGAYFINVLTSQYGKNSTITKMLEKWDYYMFPNLNPDGYAYTWTWDNDPNRDQQEKIIRRVWRRNRNNRGFTPPPDSNVDANACIGVDLNRNFGYGFGKATGADDPCNEVYAGPNSFSEKESTAFKETFEKYQNRIRAYMDVHSAGQTVLIPFGNTYKLPVDLPDQFEVAGAMTQRMNDYLVFPGIFIYGTTTGVYYLAGGDSIDWVYGTKKLIHSYTIELSPAFGECSLNGCFIVSKDLIPKVREYFLAGMIKFGEALNKKSKFHSSS